MKTIEERAIQNLIYEQDFCGRSLSDNMVCRAYVKGATDQKTIDNDKAKEAFNKACGWLSYYSWFNEVAEEFIKALEE